MIKNVLSLSLFFQTLFQSCRINSYYPREIIRSFSIPICDSLQLHFCRMARMVNVGTIKFRSSKVQRQATDDENACDLSISPLDNNVFGSENFRLKNVLVEIFEFTLSLKNKYICLLRNFEQIEI